MLNHFATIIKKIIDWVSMLLWPIILLLLFLLQMLLSGCINDDLDDVFIRSQQAIEDQGYTFIIYEGRAWQACGEGDSNSLKYSATSNTGRRVTLAACSGCRKGVTVRTID